MVLKGEVDALMKGSLHTDELMAAVVASTTGLRTARRISHVFVMDVPAYDRILFVTDAAINIEPSLKEKADIAQNAIDRFVGFARDPARQCDDPPARLVVDRGNGRARSLLESCDGGAERALGQSRCLFTVACQHGQLLSQGGKSNGFGIRTPSHLALKFRQALQRRGAVPLRSDDIFRHFAALLACAA